MTAPHPHDVPGTALKGCPFCGGEATVSSETCGWRVDCIERDCYTRGPWPDDCTEAEAIAAWNTRAPDPQLIAENEALRAALEPFAEAGNFWPSWSGDSSQPWPAFRFTVGDFRRARTLLSPERQLGEGENV